MKVCNKCKQPIRGLDYNGRCEDCYADDMQHAVSSGWLSRLDAVKMRRDQSAGGWRLRNRRITAMK